MSDYQVKTFFLEAVREKTKVVGKDADAFSVFAKKKESEGVSVDMCVSVKSPSQILA